MENAENNQCMCISSFKLSSSNLLSHNKKKINLFAFKNHIQVLTGKVIYLGWQVGQVAKKYCKENKQRMLLLYF